MGRAMSDEPRVVLCVKCRMRSPQPDAHGFISAKHGWRLSRRLASDGNVILEWRCPACAEHYKKLRALAGVPSGFFIDPDAPPKNETK